MLPILVIHPEDYLRQTGYNVREPFSIFYEGGSAKLNVKNVTTGEALEYINPLPGNIARLFDPGMYVFTLSCLTEAGGCSAKISLIGESGGEAVRSPYSNEDEYIPVKAPYRQQWQEENRRRQEEEDRRRNEERERQRQEEANRRWQEQRYRSPYAGGGVGFQISPEVSLALGLGLNPTLWDILGVQPGASARDVKTAYRRLALRWHPDKNPQNPRLAEAVIKTINNAYEALSVRLGINTAWRC